MPAVTEHNGTQYGRSDAEWDDMESVALAFLVDRARMKRTTSYTELNAALSNRTSARPFDFSLDSERGAMGHLLYRVVGMERPRSGHMISALVLYLNGNDAGSGFYGLAEELGALRAGASAAEREAFWTCELTALYDFYATRRRSRPDR